MEKLQLDESIFSVDRTFLKIESQSRISLLDKEEVEELIRYLQNNLENFK